MSRATRTLLLLPVLLALLLPASPTGPLFAAADPSHGHLGHAHHEHARAGRAHDDLACVVGPDAMAQALEKAWTEGPAHTKGTDPLAAGEWQGDVYVMPWIFSGSYDRDLAGSPNVLPRQWVGQSFFAQNPDRYDFLLVFTNFAWDAGEFTRGLYWSIANDVDGIGVPIFDLSSEFGSEALQGYVDGMLLSDYRLSDGSLDERRVTEILNHEFGHRWLVHPDVDEGSGPTNDLRGRDDAHWHYLLDSQASFLYGSTWTDNGDGTFTATEVRRRFSELDLYLMGFLPEEDVSPITLLENPDIDREQIPILGDTVTATARELDLDAVIAAEGARSPGFADSQKEFRVGVVYLVDPAIGWTTQDVELLGNLGDFWEESLFLHTRGRAVVDPTFQGDLPPGGADVDLESAIAWLARRDVLQWQDSAVTLVRDTAETVEALGRAGGHFDVVEDALRLLPTASAPAAELRHRRLESLARWSELGDPDVAALASAAAAEQGDDGGFSAFPRYSADPVTTARAARALATAGHPAEAARSWDWLLGVRNADGGWGWQVGNPSSVPATLEVLLTARVLDPAGFWDWPEVAAGYAWLLGKRSDGGFGDTFPNVSATALFLQLTLDQSVDQTLVQQAIDFLASHQLEDGSWEGSYYKTGLAVSALVAFLLPDPFIDPGEALADPVDPFDDESAALIAAVRNGGLPLDAGTEYVWQVYRAGEDVPALTLDGVLPALPEVGFHTVNDTLAPGLLPGDYEIRFTIDPYRKISERTRDNNSVTLPFEVRAHPAGIDLSITGNDLLATPEEIAGLPQPVTVSGIVRNLGLTDATGAVVAVYDGQAVPEKLLGTTTVDVGALGMAPFSVAVALADARPHDLLVVVDPDRVLADANTFDNTAAVRVLLRLVTDLGITLLDVDPIDPDVGDSVVLRATVTNLGTVPVADFPVRFSFRIDASESLIQNVFVAEELAPGESTVVEVPWVPNLGGAQILVAEVDPQDTLGDAVASNDRQEVPITVGGSLLTNLRVLPENLVFTPSPPLQGQLAEVRITIENPTANAAPAFRAQLWLDGIGETSLADQVFAGLGAGETVDLAVDWDVVDPQDRLIYALVDPADEVAEFVEDDNQAFVEADVQTLPDLAVTSGGVHFTPDFPRGGDVIHFDVEVLNAGDQSAPESLLELVDSAGTVLDSVPVPSMAGHTQVVLGLDWDPAGEVGDFPLAVRVNAAASFPELDRTNNEASFSIAIQDGDLYVANQIFSPNGDGVRDTATFFFRTAALAIEIRDRDDRVVRTLEVPDGAESVLFDGKSDEGNLLRDGIYRARLDDGVGEIETWVAVDNNLFAVTSELDQKLLVGFLEPELPGYGDEYSRFDSIIVNPETEELYAAERKWSSLTSEETWTLRRFAGDEMIEIGPYPENGPDLVASSTAGDAFIVRSGGSFDLLEYPGPTRRDLDGPDEYSWTPWISPDGRFVLWASDYMDGVVLEDLDTGDTHAFDADPWDGYSICGYAVTWSAGGRAIVSVPTWSDFVYYYEIDTLADPPTSVVRRAEGDLASCGGGGIPSVRTGDEPDSAAVSAAGAAEAGDIKAGGGYRGTDLDPAVSADRRTVTWVVGESDYYYYGDVRTGDDEFEVVWNEPRGGDEGAGDQFRIDWRADGKAGAGSTTGGAEDFQWKAYGDGGISIRVHALDGGDLVSEGSIAVDSDPYGPPPVTSLSNDGEVMAFVVDSYGYYQASPSIERQKSTRWPRGLVPAVPPEALQRAIGRPTLVEKGEGGGGSAEQQLADWQRGDDRLLPFDLRDPLWTPVDKYLVGSLDTAYEFDGLVPYFTPAANLTVSLRPRVLFGDAGVDLWILATDRYLDFYRIEYADLDAPAGDGSLIYESIGLPADEPLFGERWGTWLPPGNGRYRLRLSARDRAGNVREATKRVVWNGDNDIANLYLEERYVSPRSSPGEKDELVFHYTVLRPANLDFTINDENGNVVARLPVAADVVGPATTTFGGNDDIGNALPDGNYELVLGEASWPFVIDNTPPEVVLRIADTQLVRELPGENGYFRDLRVNEIFAAARDFNLLEWRYETRTSEAPDWVVITTSDTPLERDGDRAWYASGAHQLVLRDLRLVGTDLAGNITVVSRSHREEILDFAEAEPGCRGSNPPCVFPDRPELDGLGDAVGRFIDTAHVLDPSYDSLLIQSTVWAANPELTLEYRPVSLTGLPSGPWQEGTIQVASDKKRREVCTDEVSYVPVLTECVKVRDNILRVYWDHTDLPLVPHEVRLSAVNDDGQTITSEEILYQPAVPLILEYLFLDEQGDHLRVTNASNGVVRDLVLAERVVVDGNVTWVPLIGLNGTDRLDPGEFSNQVSGCALLTKGGKTFRMQGTGSLGEEAVSLPIVIPPREGYSALSTSFSVGGCSAGTFDSGEGGGFSNAKLLKPCKPPSIPWPTFWVGRGDQPWPVNGRVPVDPTGVPVERYELLVDGVPVHTVDGPVQGLDHFGSVDLTAFGEGTHTFSERYTYPAGQAGLLGTCPQSFPVTVDRTPPAVTIAAPADGAVICPADLTFDVELDIVDATSTRKSILVDGGGVGGSPACSPYGPGGGTYEIEANLLEPGIRQLQARVSDQAGNATCTYIEIEVPDLPNILLGSSPAIFSPVNTLDRPIQVDIDFVTGTPGSWETQIENSDGDLMAFWPVTPTDGVEEILLAWAGTDLGGLATVDGTYTARVTAYSPCGASQTKSTSFELDQTPPEVILGAPTSGLVVGSAMEFQGLVRDKNFEAYALEVFQLDGGSDWVRVGGARRETEDVSASLGVWQTDGFPAGDYLARIRAWDRPGNEGFSTEVPVTVRERRFIKRFDRQPEIFSPNGDGIFDQLEIEFELFQDALISLHLVDETDTIVATLDTQTYEVGGAPGAKRQWSGALDLGGLAPDAEYQLVILAEDPEVPQTLESEEEQLSATVDTLPPELGVMNPVENSLSGLTLQITGSLAELHPDTWTLDLQRPDGERNQVAEGTGTYAGRQLWQLVDDPDGEYIAVVDAVDVAGNQAQLARRFRVDNTAPAVVILRPEGGEVINTLEEPLALEGEIEEENLIAWAFAYAPGFDPDPADFVRIHGVDALDGQILADGPVDHTWDASGMADGPYTIRLEASDQPGRTVETRVGITIDNTPPEVRIDDPVDGAVIGDPMDVLGLSDDANMRRWDLELLPAIGGPPIPVGVGASNVDGVLADWSVLPADGDYGLRLFAEDRAGNTAETAVNVAISVTPPSPPVLISAEVSNLEDVVLVWQPGPGPAPRGYNVYRDGVRINGARVDDTTYTDTALPDGLYGYTVRALDRLGEETDDSNALEARIDRASPLAKISAPSDGERVSDLVQIYGTAWRETGLAGWVLYLRGEVGGFVPIGSGTAAVLSDLLTPWDTVSVADGFYDLKLEVDDIHGNRASDQITVEVDNTEPIAPVLTVAFADAQDPDAEINDIHVEWTIDPVPADLAGFYLYRNGQLANAPGPVVGTTEPFLLGGSPYDDKDLVDGTYVYFVTAADTAGNESATSNLSDEIVIDTRRPHAVIVQPEDGDSFEDTVLLVAEVPDLDVVSMQFEARPVAAGSWTPIGAALPAPPWQVLFDPEALGLSTPDFFEVRAIAADGVGPDPAPESITIEETNLAPNAPTTLDLRVDGGTIHLEWTPVEDPTGDLEGYNVYRGSDLLTPTPLPMDQLDYADSGDSGLGLDDGGYSYRVAAVDDAGNEGDPSPWEYGVVSTPTFDWVQPITPNGTIELRGNVFDYNDEVDLSKWDGVGEFQVLATATDGFSDPEFAGVELDPGLNLFRIVGRSDDGDRTKASEILRILRRDPPATPEDLVATVAGPGISLAWTPDADPAVVGYEVYRDGFLFGQSTAPFAYDSGTHGLAASSGNLADWQRAVDGSAGTVWTPVDANADGAHFEWTFDSGTWLDYVDVRFGNFARRFSVDVLVDGEWLWWYYRSSNFSTVRRVYLGLEVEGLRLRIPPGFYCTSCTLAELEPLARTRPTGPPVVDPIVGPGAYIYEVEAVNRYGLYSGLAETTALVGVDPPQAPTDLVADASGCREITVGWTAPTTLPAVHLGYRLERSVDGGGFQTLTTVDALTLGHLDTGLAEGVLYTYRARTLAEIDGIEVPSAPSNEASASASCTSPPAPVLLEPTEAGVPISLPVPITDVGGRAYPGSDVTLVHDGNEVRTLVLPGVAPDRAFDLPTFLDLSDALAVIGGGTVADGLEDGTGSHMAYVADDGSGEVLRVVDLGTGATTDIPGNEPDDPTLSPDGQRVVYTDWQPFTRDLHLYDLGTGEHRQLTDDEDWVWSPRFLPSGRSVAYLAESNTDGSDSIRLLDLATGVVDIVWSHPFFDLEGFALSPDGSLAAVGTWDGPKIIDLATGELVQEIWTYTRPAISASAFSPDGDFLSFVSPTWSMDQAEVYVAHVEFGFHASVSPADGEVAGVWVDSRTLAVLQGQGDGSFDLLYRYLWDGAEQTLVTGIDGDDLPYFSEATALTRDAHGVLWLATYEGLLRIERPSGAFVFPDVVLHAGTNTFVARQEVDGAGGIDVQDSLPIEVNVDADAFGNAVAVEVLAAPEYPVTGQIVAVDGVARNDGQADIDELVGSLLRISPAGVAEVVLTETFELEEGEEHRLRYLWDTTGQEGDYRFRLVLDPADAIIELDESDNTAALLVPLRDGFGVDATVRTDRTTYMVGESVAALATVSSNGPGTATSMVLRIETEAGEWVADLDTAGLPDFGYGSHDLQGAWSTSGFYPGNYRARVVAEQAGSVAAEATAVFTLTERVAASVVTTADRPSYVRGTVANLLARVRNEGDGTLRDATVRLVVEPTPTGAAVATEDRDLPPLGIDALRDVPWAFETNVEPGAYDFRAVVLAADGSELASSEPYGFVVTAVGAEFDGELEADPAVLEPGDDLDLEALVSNLGDLAAPDSILTVDIVDPRTGAVLHTLDDVADLDVGATVQQVWPYTPEMTGLGSYLAVLGATLPSRGGTSETLASATFTLADLTPPTVEVLEPAPVCTPVVAVRVRVDDLLSGVFAVTYTVDGGTLPLPMILESVDDNVWTSLLILDPERTDPYLLTVVAEDSVGNRSEPLEVELLPELDIDPPVLMVDAPVDGACVAGPVAATWSVEDANPDTLYAWLDDVPYTSGTPIADGIRTLRILAADSCGLTDEDERSFTVDSLAPELDVTGVEDDTTYEEPVILEWSATDENLVSVEATLNDLPIDAPYEVVENGSYVLRVVATDCAGNRTERELVFLISTGPDVPEIPTLGTWALLLMTLLLSAAGAHLLRRGPASGGFDPFLQTPFDQTPSGGGPSMTPSLRERLARLLSRLGLLALLCVGLGVLGFGPSDARAETCSGQFPELRQLLSGPGGTKSVDDGQRSRLLDELAVEEAIWADLLRRQREELGDRGVSGSGSERLAALDAEIGGQLRALQKSLEDGTALPEAAVEGLVGCLVEKSTDAVSGGEPISFRLAPKVAQLDKRSPRVVTESPAGHLDPPDEALRARVAREKVGSAERAARFADEKFAPGRIDPIAAKVEELESDPVALYRYVLREIRPAHYFGQIRGPEATLRAGEGNDADQAGLLAALLRAADIPARMGWGVREIPTDALLNHFGLDPAASPSELERLLTAAGIPWDPVVQGGRPVAYALERAWTEAYLPFANYRGVVLDDTGFSWIALDPQLASLEPREAGSAPAAPVLDSIGLDGRTFVDSYLAGDSCVPPLTTAGACPTPSSLLTPLVDALGSGGWDAATAPAESVQVDDPVLPAGLVGTLRSLSGFGLEFPDDFSHRVRLRARRGNGILMDVTVRASALSGLESVIWYRPATLDDEALVAQYGDLWLVPPYLVNVRPELWVDGETLAVGSGVIGMGEAFELEATLLLPSGDSLSFANGQISGVPVGLGLAPGVHGYLPPEGGPGNTPEVLTTLVGAYMDAAGDFAGRLARAEGLGEVHPHPSFATVGSVVEPRGAFGLVEELHWLGIYVDADVFGPRTVGDSALVRRWLELTQLEASVQERRIFEAYGMASVSADAALILARDQGSTILEIDASNVDTLLPPLPFDAAVKEEIDGWVRAGGEALLPSAALDFIEFSGLGYVLRDPLTGEARYQLAGGLSGGMIAVPPFEVVPNLASPLQLPQNGQVINDGTKAVSVEIFDGNMQIGKVAETLGRPLRVVVKDSRGRLVSNAEVNFEVLGGDGKFGGATTISATSQGGVATVELTAGTKTDVNPYYLLFPEEEWSQRTDLTVITAEVNGYPMNDLFYAIGKPGDVTQLLTPYGTSQDGLPHTVLGTPLRVIPADEHSNPVANTEVTFTLQGSPGSEPGEGPELISNEAKVACGGAAIVLAGECSATGEVVDEGSVSGVWAHLVVGGDGGTQVSVQATGDNASGSTTFTGNAVNTFIPTGDFVGWPAVLVSARGQPRAEGGESQEAYAPGDQSIPLRVSMVVYTQKFTTSECGDGNVCTSPTDGKFETRRLATDGVPDCSPDGCAPGTLTETGNIQFSGAGSGTSVSSPVEEGVYEHVITMPSAPGRYEIDVTPTVEVLVPDQVDDDDAPPNEVKPCIDGDPACGAKMKLEELSSDSWGTQFVLWSVRGRIDGTPPVVVLGHDKLHEEESEVPYVIEPSNYPALSTAVVFIENGTVPVFARQDGNGDGTATLPVGRIFDHPEGDHEVTVMVNPGWVWTPDEGGEPVPMVIESDNEPLKVVMLDADIDADNDNGVGNPDGDLGEENVEENGGEDGWGKIVFANRDDSDGTIGDGIPDYADLEISGDTSMVPVTVEIRPEGGNYGGVQLSFDYPGPAASDVPDTGFAGDQIHNSSYRDYTDVETGTMRLWDVEQSSDARSRSDYVEPNQPKSASAWGFSSSTPKKTFWLEGIEGIEAGTALAASDLKVKINFEGEDAEDLLKVTVVQGELGFNHGNDQNDDDLRPGVPDVDFYIDEHDDMIEDQGDGLEWWRDTANGLDIANLQDTMPFLIDVPEELFELFDIGLRMPSSPLELVRVYIGAPHGDPGRIDYLKTQAAGEGLVAAAEPTGEWLLPGSARKLDLQQAETGLLLLPREKGDEDSANPQRNTVRLDLVARPKDTTDDWVTLDSVRLTLDSINRFYSQWSSRGDPNNFFLYPLECHPQTACAGGAGPRFELVENYPNASHVAGTGMPDPYRKVYFTFVHGYNVPLDAAKNAAGFVYKRTFWQGFRGNVIGYTWHGDQARLGPLSLFAPNVENAFQTEEPFRRFMEQQVGGTWAVPVQNRYVMAHSLGNHVVAGGLRLHSILGSGPLFNRFFLVQPAVWQETFWPQTNVDYTTGSQARNYTVDDLRTNSWAFWFNQAQHPVTASASSLTHSWASQDFALKFMLIDDRTLRNPNGHVFRGDASDLDQRLPYESNGDSKNLAHQVAVMLQPPERPFFYDGDNLMLPAGTTTNGAANINIQAENMAWPSSSHSAFQDEPLPVIWGWWSNAITSAIPLGTERD